MILFLFMNELDILKGHLNEVLKKNEKIYNRRMKICKQCPLYKETKLGAVCDFFKYISLDGNDISLKAKEGYVRGCGCRLSAKTRLEDAKCIINKW